MSYRLHRNALTGAIPPELGDLSNLVYLSLNGNQLTGGIPSSLGDLSHLTHLWLKDNRLTGAIPASLEGLGLTEVRLSGNQFTGCIPNAWRNVHDNDFAEAALSLCTPAGEVTLRASDLYFPVETRVTLTAAADPSTGRLRGATARSGLGPAHQGWAQTPPPLPFFNLLVQPRSRCPKRGNP